MQLLVGMVAAVTGAAIGNAAGAAIEGRLGGGDKASRCADMNAARPPSLRACCVRVLGPRVPYAARIWTLQVAWPTLGCN